MARVPGPEWAWSWKFYQIWISSSQNYHKSTRAEFKQIFKKKKKIKKWLELQKKQQNRRDFSSRAMMKEAGASFSLYSKEARADFLFQREKRMFLCFLITFESLGRSRWVFFCLNQTAEKRLHFRDLSVANYGVREVITITEKISSISKMENTFWGRIIVNNELIKRNFGKGKLILF